ncbi:MAG: SUMF1/EgtB/PvdO family nonheme iron enzyme [Treponematales bacterium]
MRSRESAGERREYLPEDRVVLPPAGGIPPGVYLTALYGLVILAVLFFALLFPGLRRPGSLLVVETEPEGAGVRLDGVYMDASPCEIFAPKGTRRVEFVLPGFRPAARDIEVPGRVFASLLFPRRLPVKAALTADDPEEAFAAAAREYAAWSFAGEPTAAYQTPLTLSEAAYRLGPALTGAETDGLLAASARFASSRAALRDLVRAKFLLDNGGLSPSPLSLPGSLGDICGYLAENPRAALWLGEVLQGAERSALVSSEWYKEGKARADAEARGGGLSGSAARVNGADYRKTRGDVYLAENPVGAGAWAEFLAAKPEWRRENLAALVREGLADEWYLAPSEAADGGGVTGVSWHAAAAWCSWQTERLPPAFAGWEVRLPTEAEWEAAGGELPGMGKRWEWCAEPFAPFDYLPAPPEAAAAVSSPERSVRGGWVNGSGPVTLTRGSLPPASCSPFVSFRPALAPKGRAP